MSFFVYDRGTPGEKLWYWTKVGMRVSFFIAFILYLKTITPIEPNLPELISGGKYTVPMEYLVQKAAFQAKTLMRDNMLTICWLWELYLLACDVTPLTRKRIWWKKQQDNIRSSLISATIVICGYTAYMMSF